MPTKNQKYLAGESIQLDLNIAHLTSPTPHFTPNAPTVFHVGTFSNADIGLLKIG